MRSWGGFKQSGIEYERDERYGEESKYPLWQLIQLALSNEVVFVTPLACRHVVWFFSVGIGFMLLLWALATKLLQSPIPHGWTSTLAAIFFVGGVPLLRLRISGEYVDRVYEEVLQRPFIIMQSRRGVTADNTHHGVRGFARAAN